MQQALVLAGLAALVGVLAVAGRFLARRRVGLLRALSPGDIWSALEAEPDGRPVVVVFSTPGCAACRTAQRPAVAALEERSAGRVRVVHVDASERPRTAQAFGVMTVPATVVIDARGTVLAANQGFATAERLAGQLGVAAGST